jgi:4-amino-4-deoxy-L-arabinose transferase-like glycosyltransferase
MPVPTRAVSPIPRRSLSLRAAAIVTLATAVLGVAARLNPMPPGLRGEYYSSADWTPPHAFTRSESHLSTRALFAAWSGTPPDRFSATWTGAILILTPGEYTFALRSDDGSALWIGGHLVVDNRGRHPVRTVEGSMHLDRGLHRLLAVYAQEGGEFEFAALWARGGEPVQPIPSWALWPRDVGALPLLALSYTVANAATVLTWLWIAVAALSVVVLLLGRLRAKLRLAGLWNELRWIVAGSFALNAMGMWWGLPAHWAAIEMLPIHVLYGLSRHFSHGWYQAYPPLHYYVLAAATSPLLVLQSYGHFIVRGPFGEGVLLALYRMVSLLAAAGTVIATAVCGAEAFGKRAGLLGAAIVALTAPFVYYAKTANVDVPYLFWFALSLVFYLRLLRNLRMADFILFAAAATCAVCTKDQAYALYLLAPAAIVYAIARRNRTDGLPHAVLRAVVDRRLLAAAATAVVVFAAVYQIPFNDDGLVRHVRNITSAAGAYRVFEPTLEGRVALLRLTVRLIVESLGWPFFIVAVIGIGVALMNSLHRRTAVWLGIVVAAYYVGLINVVLYNYDRFVLPICVVLAMFGGLSLDAFLADVRENRRWRVAAVAAAFAYGVLYAGTVDVLMIRDSRYTVGTWMASHLDRNDVVGVTGLYEYLPDLAGYTTIDLTTIEQLRRERPRYFILNADYARAVPATTAWGQLGRGLQNGTLGYRRRFEYRTSAPWPWLPGAHPDLVGPRQETLVFSVLRNVNPEIEVFERDADAPPDKLQ